MKKNYTVRQFLTKKEYEKNNIKTYIKEIILIGVKVGKKKISKYIIKRLNCISIWQKEKRNRGKKISNKISKKNKKRLRLKCNKRSSVEEISLREQWEMPFLK